eukprot:439381-Prymnesium_polylepis.1
MDIYPLSVPTPPLGVSTPTLNPPVGVPTLDHKHCTARGAGSGTARGTGGGTARGAGGGTAREAGGGTARGTGGGTGMRIRKLVHAGKP